MSSTKTITLEPALSGPLKQWLNWLLDGAGKSRPDNSQLSDSDWKNLYVKFFGEPVRVNLRKIGWQELFLTAAAHFVITFGENDIFIGPGLTNARQESIGVLFDPRTKWLHLLWIHTEFWFGQDVLSQYFYVTYDDMYQSNFLLQKNGKISAAGDGTQALTKYGLAIRSAGTRAALTLPSGENRDLVVSLFLLPSFEGGFLQQRNINTSAPWRPSMYRRIVVDVEGKALLNAAEFEKQFPSMNFTLNETSLVSSGTAGSIGMTQGNGGVLVQLNGQLIVISDNPKKYDKSYLLVRVANSYETLFLLLQKSDRSLYAIPLPDDLVLNRVIALLPTASASASASKQIGMNLLIGEHAAWFSNIQEARKEKKRGTFEKIFASSRPPDTDPLLRNAYDTFTKMAGTFKAFEKFKTELLPSYHSIQQRIAVSNMLLMLYMGFGKPLFQLMASACEEVTPTSVCNRIMGIYSKLPVQADESALLLSGSNSNSVIVALHLFLSDAIKQSKLNQMTGSRVPQADVENAKYEFAMRLRALKQYLKPTKKSKDSASDWSQRGFVYALFCHMLRMISLLALSPTRPPPKAENWRKLFDEKDFPSGPKNLESEQKILQNQDPVTTFTSILPVLVIADVLGVLSVLAREQVAVAMQSLTADVPYPKRPIAKFEELSVFPILKSVFQSYEQRAQRKAPMAYAIVSELIHPYQTDFKPDPQSAETDWLKEKTIASALESSGLTEAVLAEHLGMWIVVLMSDIERNFYDTQLWLDIPDLQFRKNPVYGVLAVVRRIRTQLFAKYGLAAENYLTALREQALSFAVYNLRSDNVFWLMKTYPESQLINSTISQRSQLGKVFVEWLMPVTDVPNGGALYKPNELLATNPLDIENDMAAVVKYMNNMRLRDGTVERWLRQWQEKNITIVDTFKYKPGHAFLRADRYLTLAQMLQNRNEERINPSMVEYIVRLVPWCSALAYRRMVVDLAGTLAPTTLQESNFALYMQRRLYFWLTSVEDVGRLNEATMSAIFNRSTVQKFQPAVDLYVPVQNLGDNFRKSVLLIKSDLDGDGEESAAASLNNFDANAVYEKRLTAIEATLIDFGIAVVTNASPSSNKPIQTTSAKLIHSNESSYGLY